MHFFGISREVSEALGRLPTSVLQLYSMMSAIMCCNCFPVVCCCIATANLRISL